MSNHDSAVRNGVAKSIEDLERELAAIKVELAQVRRERDEFRSAVYGFLQREALSRRDEFEEQMGLAVSEPSMADFLANLRNS